MKRITFLVIIIVTVTFAGGCSKEKKESPPAPRSAGGSVQVPDFTLSGPNGQVTLSALKGNLVLVHFWATWCPPCREELPYLAKLNGIMAGKPFKLLAISIDKEGNAAVQRLFGQLGITLPVLLDQTNEVAGQYGITGVPETFIISPGGALIKKIVGPLEWTGPEAIAFLNDAMKAGN